jgi:hypothetical protein
MVPDDLNLRIVSEDRNLDDLNLEEMDNLSINEEGQQQQNELAISTREALTPAARAGHRRGLQAHTATPPPIRFRHGRRLHTHPVPSRHGRTMNTPSQLYAVMAQDEEASRERMMRMELMGMERRESLRLSRLCIDVLLRENRDNHREVQI